MKSNVTDQVKSIQRDFFLGGITQRKYLSRLRSIKPDVKGKMLASIARSQLKVRAQVLRLEKLRLNRRCAFKLGLI